MFRGPFGQVLIVKPLSLSAPKKRVPGMNISPPSPNVLVTDPFDDPGLEFEEPPEETPGKRDRSSTLVATSRTDSNVPSYDFTYADKDTLENEILEFYNYHDYPLLARGQALCADLDPDLRIPTTSVLWTWLEALSVSTPSIRITHASRLLYYSQGWFSETQTIPAQLGLIVQHNKRLWKMGALQMVFDGLKYAVHGFEKSTASTHLSSQGQISEDLFVLECNIYLSLLFMMLEVNYANPEFTRDVVLMDPYLPQFLTQTLTRLADGNRQNFPIKKFMLVLWRTLQTIVGTDERYAQLKAHLHKQHHLPITPKPPSPLPLNLKSHSQDYHHYFLVANTKYPTYYLPEAVGFLPNVNESLLRPPELHIVKQINILKQCLYSPSEQCPPLSILPVCEDHDVPPAIRETVDMLKHYHYISVGEVQMARELEIQADKRNEWLPMNLKPCMIPDPPSIPEESWEDEALKFVKELHTSLLSSHNATFGMLFRCLFFLSVGPNGENVKIDPYIDEETAECERLDMIRHREVATKAISAIISLLMRAAKLHHALSAEYVSQLLVDNNFAMLILKMMSQWFPNPHLANLASLARPSPSTSANYSDASSPDRSTPSVTDFWLRKQPDVAQLNFFHFCHSLDKEEGLQEPIPEPVPVRSFVKPKVDVETSLGFSPPPTPHPNAHGQLPSLPSPIEPNPAQHFLEPASFRNFFSAIHLLKILHKMTKGKPHRLLAMTQWKASFVFKRVLKVNHPSLMLFALKLLKGQVPFLGKKWRGNNMKVVSLIYLHLNPSLREEYLSGEIELDSENALAKEQELRQLIAAYHRRNFGLDVSEPKSATVIKTGL